MTKIPVYSECTPLIENVSSSKSDKKSNENILVQIRCGARP